MKLVPKLSLTIIAGVSLVLGMNGYLRVKREVALFEADRIRDNVQIGKTLAAAVTTVWHTDGPSRAQAMVRQADAQEGRVRVRWIWLDDGAQALPVSRDRIRAIPEGGSLSLVGKSGAEDEHRYTFVPLVLQPNGAAPSNGVEHAALEISEPLESERAYARRTVYDTVATTLTLDALCAALAMLLGALIVGRPMRALMDKARRVGAGDFSGPLTLHESDELAALAAEMNTMCDRLVAANGRAATEMRARLDVIEQLRHADRLMTVGKLASGIAHELGTPLNVIEARAAMIGSGETTQEESASYAAVIVRAAERMTKIIRQLLAFARPREVHKTRCDVALIAQRTIELLQPLAQKRGAVLRVSGLAPVYVDADGGQIEQAVTNLVMNAAQSLDMPGEVEVAIARTREKPPLDHGGPEADYVGIHVRDQGRGISSEHLQRVFEPFFTTKDVGEGTGLGLAVTHGIVRDHGGWISVTSEVGRGSEFTVHLPVARDA